MLQHLQDLLKLLDKQNVKIKIKKLNEMLKSNN